ncbi:MAG TPA: UvrD-helicase domain-containing protein [Vicinamibacterales bacterium]|nr:UvrD-helicase domain-containing protein [Vicinamibacterales bacterium]
MSNGFPPDADADARGFAVNPDNNVVLEASAGTGKTTVLVQRYINLLKAGVEPANILAITFTRKAATEMRERIVRDLRAAAGLSEFDRARWVGLRDRLSEISISTIDAFCLSLLREFPLEADLDPGFDMADETEVPRFVEESLDRSMRIFAGIAKQDEDVALVIAQLGVSRTRAGLASLLQRRLVAWDALDRFLAKGPRDLTADGVCRRAARGLSDALRAAPGGWAQTLADGPSGHPRYQLLLREARRLEGLDGAGPAEIRTMLDRMALHFLTLEGKARKGGAIPPYNATHAPTPEAARRHREAVFAVAPQVERVVRQFSRDLNVVLARGIRRMFAIALTEYRRTLEARAVLDFSDVLDRALVLLRRMDEFSQSRFRLESRYHHVLVDEFQDTSRAQWELVSLLVQSWGEGLGLASNPSIFIVGDRKQSIYRFRDAEVAVLQEAGRYIDALRADSASRRSIARSFRAVPELLEFVNDLCSEMAQAGVRPDDFTYRDTDRFPPAIAGASPGSPEGLRYRGQDRPVLGIAAADDPAQAAAAVADEIARILTDEVVRDRTSGLVRAATPGDIAILFRSRTSHREFEHELAMRAIPTYVYKGLGFFDSDEIKDASALLRFLASPRSDLRAAAFLRSRFARVSDAGIATLSPGLAEALVGDLPESAAGLDPEDRRVLDHVRLHVPAWLARVDRIPPADLFEQILPDTAYAFEMRGRRHVQAWENLKKMRGLVRRVQNRGYATLGRIADHIDSLTAGDESNAVLEAIDAVNLMTVHASKGLEFPVVFVVNMARGAGGLQKPVRVTVDGEGGEPSVSVSPFVSETDDLEREREQHETRRLLYVATTRARDRLYLSSSLKEGQMAAGRGGLADVLPNSLRALFAAAAATSEETVTWTAASGRAFTWRVCRPAQVADAISVVTRSDAEGSLDMEAPLVATEREPRVSASEWLRRVSGDEPGGPAGSGQDALVGSLVHRLFQARAEESDDVPGTARRLMRAAERNVTEDADADAAIVAAVALWRSMRTRADVQPLLEGASVLTEVPFSLRVASGEGTEIVRGTIDCLVEGADGLVTILEFKTGRARTAHQAQLDLYVRAARALFPGRSVEGRLIYSHH